MGLAAGAAEPEVAEPADADAAAGLGVLGLGAAATAGAAEAERRQFEEQAQSSLKEAAIAQAKAAGEVEVAKAEKSRLLEKSKVKIRQIKETVEILGAKLNSVQKEKSALEQIAIQNKHKFEERLLEFERTHSVYREHGDLGLTF